MKPRSQKVLVIFAALALVLPSAACADDEPIAMPSPAPTEAPEAAGPLFPAPIYALFRMTSSEQTPGPYISREVARTRLILLGKCAEFYGPDAGRQFDVTRKCEESVLFNRFVTGEGRVVGRNDSIYSVVQLQVSADSIDHAQRLGAKIFTPVEGTIFGGSQINTMDRYPNAAYCSIEVAQERALANCHYAGYRICNVTRTVREPIWPAEGTRPDLGCRAFVEVTAGND